MQVLQKVTDAAGAPPFQLLILTPLPFTLSNCFFNFNFGGSFVRYMYALTLCNEHFSDSCYTIQNMLLKFSVGRKCSMV